MENTNTQQPDEDFEVVAVELPYTYTLKFPFDYAKERIETITILRRGRASDLMNAPSDGMSAIVHLLSRLTSDHKTKIERIDLEDINALADVVANFTPASR